MWSCLIAVAGVSQQFCLPFLIPVASENSIDATPPSRWQDILGQAYLALLYSREYSVRSCFLSDRTYAYPSIPCARVRKWIQKLLKPRKFQDLSGHYWMEVVIHTKEWDFQKGNGYFWACMTASFSTGRNSFLCVSRAWASYTWECKSYFASLVDDKGCS